LLGELDEVVEDVLAVLQTLVILRGEV